MKGAILVVDDEPAIREGLVETLASSDINANEVSDARQALDFLENAPVDVVITDVRMPGMDGMELLHRIREKHPDVIVILLTAHATYPMAVEAVKAGAWDFLTKPFDIEQVRLAVRRALDHRRLATRNAQLERDIDRLQGPSEIIGDSPDFRRVLELVARVAPTPSTVLITGETGTGKEVVARAIHQASERRDRPFLTINCGALSETLLESELFGHTKGAFTGADRPRPGLFEAADRGTFLLDEIGNISPAVQGKLLRVLQEGEILRIGERSPRHVDVRILAATNTDLQAGVRNGSFREDLFYRLNVFRLELPPLRDRPEDIRPLALTFVKRLARKLQRPVPKISQEVFAALEAHDWPGNVRELENAIERALILVTGDHLETNDLPSEVGGSHAISRTSTALSSPGKRLGSDARRTRETPHPRGLERERWSSGQSRRDPRNQPPHALPQAAGIRLGPERTLVARSKARVRPWKDTPTSERRSLGDLVDYSRASPLTRRSY